jgi:hypothetical protein
MTPSALADSSTVLVSDLVSATEVYGPIFGMGIVLSVSGFVSAWVVSNLVDDANIEEVFL